MDKIEQEYLSEIYSLVFQEMQEFRKNNIRLFFGLTGLIIFLLGWILTKENPIETKQKVIISVGIIVISFVYLYISKVIMKYFLQAASTIQKIDKIYGFYQKGKYIPNDTLLPKEWFSFGSKHWKEPMFIASNIGAIVLSLFSISLIWLY